MKRSSRKKRIAKLSKLGLSLAAITVLGGLVEPGVADFGLTKVYATEQADPALEARKAEIKTMIQSYRDLVGQIKALNPADYTEESWNKNYDGDVRIYLGAQSIATAYNDDLTFSSLSLDGVDSHQTLNELNATYLFGYQFVENAIPILKQAMADLVPVSKPIETPTDKPAETPVEQPEPTEKPVETPSIISTDSPTAPQLTSGQPTVEDGYDVVTLQYRDENGEDLGEDLMMVYPTSPQRITPPAIEGYEFKEASVGENYLMYSKPISLPYEHRFAQVLTEQDLNNHSNFLGGKIKEAQDSLRDGSAYTYILNYRKTSPSDQAPVEQPEPTEKPVETPTEKQVTSSEVRILNVDGATYWKGEELDKAVVGTTTVELEVGGDLAIPATVVPEGYEITDVRFNALSTGVKELPHTWAYEEYKNYTSAPMSVPEIDILVKPVSKPVETSVSTQPAETSVVTPANKPAETLGDPSVGKPAETLSETSATSPAETPTNVQPSTDPAGQSATEPTVLSKQASQAGTASPTGQSAPGKQETKQEAKEQAAPASPSKQATAKSAPTSQPQAKSLPATGEAHSVLHMTGMSLLGLAGLVVKRRSRKSS
ncbi:TPA: LPXTG cell wall anchor domain-containing protein [Streptococcus suis]